MRELKEQLLCKKAQRCVHHNHHRQRRVLSVHTMLQCCGTAEVWEGVWDGSFSPLLVWPVSAAVRTEELQTPL